MKFNELLNSFINEQEGADLKPLNPTGSQIKTYFSTNMMNEDGRKEIINMLVEIFTVDESNLLAVVAEYYQTMHSKAMNLPQRNAPIGKAKVARNRAKQTKPAAPQPKANNKFPGPPSDKFHPAI